jgi:hypothetical protein
VVVGQKRVYSGDFKSTTRDANESHGGHLQREKVLKTQCKERRGGWNRGIKRKIQPKPFLKYIFIPFRPAKPSQAIESDNSSRGLLLVLNSSSSAHTEKLTAKYSEE